MTVQANAIAAPAAKPAATTSDLDPKTRSNVNKAVILIVVGLLLAAGIGVALVFWFVSNERQRDLQGWQIRMGIVADSRKAAVEEWFAQQFATVRELSDNASLQLYMTQLQLMGPAAAAAADAAEAGYLRNLLAATAERAGFKPPAAAAQLNANVAPLGVAGIALADRDGNILVATPAMPPIEGALRDSIRRIPGGTSGVVDMYVGLGGDPTIGFVTPVYSIQGGRGQADAIGMVVAVRIVGNDLFSRLAQPGETEQTAETYLVRSTGPDVEYLSPLKDGSAPLKRRLDRSTPNLADTFVLETSGGFNASRVDYAGVEVLATGRPLTVVPWTLVRKVTSAEALAESQRRQFTLLTTLLLVIIGVTVTIIAVWRHGSSVRAAEAAERHRIAAERFSNIMKFLRVVTDGQPTRVVAVTEDGTFTFANATASEGTGITKDEMMGKTMAQVWGPVRAKFYQEVNRDIIANREEILAAKRRISHIKTFEEQGGRRVVRSFHIPLRSDRDHPPGCLMIVDDITEFVEQRERRDRIMDQLVSTLLEVVGRTDPLTAEQPSRAAAVGEAIANEMGLDDDALRTVRIAAKLMNLGRASVAREVIARPGPLTAAELEQVRSAIRGSAEQVKGIDFDGDIVDVLRQVHERVDGAGPLKRKGDDILLAARIVALADAFSAMISPRAYRAPLSMDAASKAVATDAGARFDRRVVAALLYHLENRGGRTQWEAFASPPVPPSAPPPPAVRGKATIALKPVIQPVVPPPKPAT